MPIMYDPRNPSIAYVMEDYYLFTSIMLAIGGVFFFGGIFAIYLVLADPP